MWSVFPKTCQYQSHGMSCGQQHRPQQNCHVIAIAGTQFQHSSRRVQELHSEDVSRIANIAFDEIEERIRFTHSVLLADPVSPKDFDRFLSNVKILCACSNELANYFRCGQCAFRSSAHAYDLNPRNNIPAGQLNHSLMPRILSSGTITFSARPSTSISTNDPSTNPLSERSTTRPCKTSLP